MARAQPDPLADPADRHLARLPFDLDAFLAAQVPAPARAPLSACMIETPLGRMVALFGAQGLHLLEFADRLALPASMSRFARGYALVSGRPPQADRLERDLAAYFGGSDAGFSVPLVLGGNPFARTVWRALQTIPPGETRSYGTLARMIGRPEAVRAVAAANGRNEIAILIPCHRIIAADGSLTGYGGGIARKRGLLALEAGIGGGKSDESS